MAFEKMPPLYVPQKDFEEKNPKEKGSCSKSFVSWVLAALLIALIIALCVQFLYPVVERRKSPTLTPFMSLKELQLKFT
ncbi:hypothetical protein CEXT_602761 [Caerostris extrusa]|uniref:Uncharacterized protein n=1 Tax=Caerostris extrusa TaxID=172846 RepID=A0AAV4SYW4_CAEEX|nr:hypothetical protein CEXT_602761 [Caerostris extrusa]